MQKKPKLSAKSKKQKPVSLSKPKVIKGVSSTKTKEKKSKRVSQKSTEKAQESSRSELQATQASAASLNTDLASENYSLCSNSEDEKHIHAEETAFNKNQPETVGEIEKNISEAIQSDKADSEVNLLNETGNSLDDVASNAIEYMVSSLDETGTSLEDIASKVNESKSESLESFPSQTSRNPSPPEEVLRSEA